MRQFMIFVLLMVGVLNAEECFPRCRAGYICHDGECVSLCNPPCSQGERCTEDGECVPVDSVFNSEKESAMLSTEQGMCREMYVIRPVMETRIPGDFSGDDLLNLGSQLAEAVASVMGDNVAVIFPTDRGVVDSCRAKHVGIRIMSYHKSPGGMGRYSGRLVISVALYGVGSRAPMSEVEMSVEGYMRWGDFRPLQKAVDKMCKMVRAELKYKDSKIRLNPSNEPWDEWVE
jgi:hypothetical protein